MRYPGTIQEFVNETALTTHFLECPCPHCRQPENRAGARQEYEAVISARLAIRRSWVSLIKGPEEAERIENVDIDGVLDKAARWRYN